MVALAVQGVGGDHQPGRVDAGGGQLVDQRGEHGDLVASSRRPRPGRVPAGHRGWPRPAGAPGRPRRRPRRAPSCRRPRPRAMPRRPASAGSVSVARRRRSHADSGRRSGGRGRVVPARPARSRSPHRPRRRRHRSGPATASSSTAPRASGVRVQPSQQLGGHVSDPAGDRGERAHPGQDRRRAQRQHHRDRVIPPLITAPVGDPGEPSQQLRALHRGRRQAPSNVGIGHDTIDRCTRTTQRWQDAPATKLRLDAVCERTARPTGASFAFPPTRRRSSIFLKIASSIT